MPLGAIWFLSKWPRGLLHVVDDAELVLNFYHSVFAICPSSIRIGVEDDVCYQQGSAAVGHRPPVEGSHDPEADPAHGVPPSDLHFKSPSRKTLPLTKTETKTIILPKSSHGLRTDDNLSSSQPDKNLSLPTVTRQDCPTGSGQAVRSDPVGHDGRYLRDLNRSFNSCNTYVSMNAEANSVRPNPSDYGPTKVVGSLRQTPEVFALKSSTGSRPMTTSKTETTDDIDPNANKW